VETVDAMNDPFIFPIDPVTYEKVEPSPFVIETIKEILAQQRMILDAHAKIIESLMNPCLLVKPGLQESMKALNGSLAMELQRMREKPTGAY
jgi:hypothetical protein